MTNKYDISPTRIEGKRDIVEHFLNLMKRVDGGDVNLRIGNTAIEDGDLVVRNGDIIVSLTDNSIVLRVIHGASPEIRWWPLGDTDTHVISMLGYNEDFYGGQTLQIAVEENDTLDADGGKVILSRDYALISHHPFGSGGEESYLWLNGDASSPQVAIYQGRWANQIQYSDLNGLYMGSFVASSGFSTWTHSYFESFATTFVPVLTVLHAGSTISWTIDAQSTASFTVRFSSTTNAKTINFWGFRL